MASLYNNDLINGRLVAPSLNPSPILPDSSSRPTAASAPTASIDGSPMVSSDPGQNGAYWVGADGNVYVKGSQGVNAAGKADANTNYYWSSRGYAGINDPNSGSGSSAPSNPNGGGSGAPALPDKSNDIALQNAGLNSVDTQTSAGMASIDKALSGLFGQYDNETNTNEGSYKTNSDQNTNNLQKNKQVALVNAAQGRQGLFGTLSSLGALNGSGIELANNAVRNGANEDLSNAADNYATNASSLDTSIGAYRQADKERRQLNQGAADNAKINVTNEGSKSKQTYYSNLANDYSAMGNGDEAKRYTGMAADLFPSIASTSVPNANISYTGAAYTPASLASYLAGSNNTSVNVTPSSGNGVGSANLPGLVASDNSKKKLLTA